MKEVINKYLTIKNRNIVAIVVIILGIGFIVNYSFFEPTYINEYIATKVYDAPANSYFDDENFYKCVVDGYNSEYKTNYAYTTNLSDSKLRSIHILQCDNKNVISTKGIEKLTSIQTLNISNNPITSLDLSQNTALSMLYASNNQLTSLDISKNTKLTYVVVSGTNIQELDVSKNTSLGNLFLSRNKLTSLDVSNNTKLTSLGLDYNQLTSIDVSKNVSLINLTVSNNLLENLNFNNNSKLDYLDISGNNFTNLDISKNTLIRTLYLDNNPILNLNLSTNTKLGYLKANGTKITELNLSKNTSLLSLEVKNNPLTNLIIGKNTTLEMLYANNNQLTSLDVSGNTSLKQLVVYNNNLTDLNISGATALTYLYAQNNKLTNLILNNNKSLIYLDAYENELTSLDVSSATALTTLRIYANQLTNLDVSKNTALTTLYLSKNLLSEIDVSKNTALATLYLSENQLSEIDVSKNTSLTSLSLTANKLTEVDVSNNKELNSLDVVNNQLTYLDISNNNNLSSYYTRISSNPYNKDIYVYNGNNVYVESNIKIPKHLEWEFSSWMSNNEDVANVDEMGMVTTYKKGIAKITSELYMGSILGRVKSTSTINVIELTSDKYIIDNDYIIVTDWDEDIIKNNINISTNINLNVDINNKILQVKYNDEILKEFNLISINSEEYDISKDYIYTRNNKLDLDKINTVNCDKELIDNKLIIKLEEKILKEYNLITISSSKYDLSKDYIYTNINKFNIEDIVITNNGIVDVKDNKLLIKYKEEILDEYELVSISSDIYDLTKEYIYLKGKDLNIDKIDNINCNKLIDNNKLVIKYNDEVLKEYKLLNIYFNNLKINNNNITLNEELSYEEFINDIEVTQGITYKLFKDEEEVISGNIEKDMIIKIYYDDIEIDEYIIFDEYLEFDESLVIDIDNSIINNIKDNTLIEDIKNKINTSGQVSVLDKDNDVIEDITNKKIGTGYKFKIEMSSNIFEYVVSVRGDINSDGLININDAVGVSRHVIKGNYLEGIEYINASDINSDNKVDINDVIRLAKHIIKGSEL